jgi:2,3-bisphosphoglycerate-independent phosphoglycerate mutase
LPENLSFQFFIIKNPHLLTKKQFYPRPDLSRGGKKSQEKDPVTIALLPDHATPCAVRTHTRDAVPFLIYRPGESPDHISEFNEETCRQGSYGLLHGEEFMKALLRLA